MGDGARALSGTLITAIIAIFISVAGLGSSLYFGLRDRARIVTRSRFYPGHTGDRPSVMFSIVNAGRRPVVIRSWGGEDERKDWVASQLGDHKSGLRLGENDHHEITLHIEDLLGETPGDHVYFVDLWFEDSLGRRYPLSDAKANIALLYES